MLLFLFLLSNPFVTVFVDRNETKENLSKNQINEYNWLLRVKWNKTKNKVKSTESNLKKTKIHLKHILNQHGKK